MTSGSWAHRAGLVAVMAILVAGTVWTAATSDPSAVLLFVSYAGVGALLVARVSHNSIGWLLVITGVGLGLGGARITTSEADILAGNLTSIELARAWANGCGWTLGFAGIYGVAAVFPTGRPAAGRQGRAAVAGMAIIVGLGLLIDISPTIGLTLPGNVQIEAPNPIGLPADSAIGAVFPHPVAMYASMFGIFTLGVIALVLRFRRSAGVERLQYQWLVASFAFVAVTSGIWALLAFGLQIDDQGLSLAVSYVGYVTVPAAIAVAVLRYRLWQIDRLISRTLGWSLATAAVLAVFGLGIVLLQAVLSDLTNGVAVSVAGSTLLAYALFQPIRRRVQGLVDRRFDRPRLEAERILGATARALRDEVEMASIEATVLEAAGSLRPEAVGIWIR
jgi:hypothetical protein